MKKINSTLPLPSRRRALRGDERACRADFAGHVRHAHDGLIVLVASAAGRIDGVAAFLCGIPIPRASIGRSNRVLIFP